MHQPPPPLWAFEVERESATQLYVRPAPPSSGPPSSAPLVTFPTGTGTLQRVTTGVRTNAVLIGFVAACIALGVGAGTIIALHGGGKTAARPAPAAAPHVEPISSPRPIVKPLEQDAAPVANRLVP